MRTILLIAAILPLFLWTLGFFVAVIIGVTIVGAVADSLTSAVDAFRPDVRGRDHAIH